MGLLKGHSQCPGQQLGQGILQISSDAAAPENVQRLLSHKDQT
jgi:hypothetical protein